MSKNNSTPKPSKPKVSTSQAKKTPTAPKQPTASKVPKPAPKVASNAKVNTASKVTKATPKPVKTVSAKKPQTKSKPVLKPTAGERKAQRTKQIDQALKKQGIKPPPKASELTYSTGSKHRSEMDFYEQSLAAKQRKAVGDSASTSQGLADALEITGKAQQSAPQLPDGYREMVNRRADSAHDYTTALPRKGSAYEGPTSTAKAAAEKTKQKKQKKASTPKKPTPKPSKKPPTKGQSRGR